MFKNLRKRWRAGLVAITALGLGLGAVVYTQGASAATWPTATGTTKLTATKAVSGTFDGGLKRFVGSGALGTDSQDEDQDPLFELADGATLKNVILGDPAADGVHCKGSCTLTNVWWENVGEDAATFKGGTSAVYTVNGGGAKGADDKVFQHNGGGTLTIKNFQVSDYGKLYRSCGNCDTQYQRHLIVENVTAVNMGGALAGINTNYNDSATFKGLILCDRTRNIDICDRFTGNDTGAEPTMTGSGPDGKYCIYSNSDLQWVLF